MSHDGYRFAVETSLCSFSYKDEGIWGLVLGSPGPQSARRMQLTPKG